MTRDLQSRLLACEHDSRRITRLELDGSLTVLASSFQGRQLNRPNDVVVKSDGAIYFTDPWTNPALPNQWDLTFSGVYRLTPDLGTMTLLVEDFVIPNGLAFSPDEKILYINDSRRPSEARVEQDSAAAVWFSTVATKMRSTVGRGLRKSEASSNASSCVLSPTSEIGTTPVEVRSAYMRRHRGRRGG